MPPRAREKATRAYVGDCMQVRLSLPPARMASPLLRAHCVSQCGQDGYAFSQEECLLTATFEKNTQVSLKNLPNVANVAKHYQCLKVLGWSESTFCE